MANLMPEERLAEQGRARRVCIVGSGPHFLSGISYYTHRLSTALADSNQVSALLMRRLIPRRLYPGRDHVGAGLNTFTYPPDVDIYDGVDWYWGRSLSRSLRFLRDHQPNVVVFQWWTGAVLHSYLAIAREARRLGARIIIEFHEVQDTGEQAVPLIGSYVDALFPRFLRTAAGLVVHSEFDRLAIVTRYGDLGDRPVAVVPHGPYDQLRELSTAQVDSREGMPCSLLYFGVIRPFKGVDDLLTAFDMLTPEEAAGFQLTLVGETWEGFTRPAQLIASSRHRSRITFINRYVSDIEAADLFAKADAVVLPYHRSSSSGPLQLAMSHGLPVVVTSVGGLIEAGEGYEGITFVSPKCPQELRDALLAVRALRGQRFDDPHSWQRTVDGFEQLFQELDKSSSSGVVP